MMADSESFIERMLELGIGMSMIQQMPAMINSVMPGANQPAAASIPPPVNYKSQTYLAVDNSQMGPFTDDELIKLIENNLLTKDTLVWRQGMPAWAQAERVPDVNKLLFLAKIK